MSAQEKARTKKAQSAVDAWTHPEGTPVTVIKDDGTILATVTRSVPWVLCGTAVIMVRGIAGAYALDRVTAVSP